MFDVWDMRTELDYFMIDGEVGGNQDWFRNLVMKIGGCAAATACDSCIYFALHRGMQKLCPFDLQELNKEEYIRFSMKMKPYIKPRVGGVRRFSMYIDGFSAYLRDLGETDLSMCAFSGEHSEQEAKELICHQIDRGYPVPCLLLQHQNKEQFKDFIWHWFLLIGYGDRKSGGDSFYVTAATYGEKTDLSLHQLWNTGMDEKGGLVVYGLAH